MCNSIRNIENIIIIIIENKTENVELNVGR